MASKKRIIRILGRTEPQIYADFISALINGKIVTTKLNETFSNKKHLISADFNDSGPDLNNQDF